MSRARSLSFGRIYGLSRVTRVWGLSRATVYRSRVETPEDTPRRRPGPIGAFAASSGVGVGQDA
jgi:putative transposase